MTTIETGKVPEVVGSINGQPCRNADVPSGRSEKQAAGEVKNGVTTWSTRQHRCCVEKAVPTVPVAAREVTIRGPVTEPRVTNVGRVSDYRKMP